MTQAITAWREDTGNRFWDWYERTSVTKKRIVLFYPVGAMVTFTELAVIQYLLNLALR